MVQCILLLPKPIPSLPGQTLPIIYFGQMDEIENFPLSTKEIHILMLLEGLFLNYFIKYIFISIISFNLKPWLGKILCVGGGDNICKIKYEGGGLQPRSTHGSYVATPLR